MSQMTPREIVQELDKHIVGQDDAKRAVAIALRNRWRRMQVDEDLRVEIETNEALTEETRETLLKELDDTIADLQEGDLSREEALARLAELIDSWRRLLYVGLPAGAAQVMIPLSMGVIMWMVAGFGRPAVAAVAVDAAAVGVAAGAAAAADAAVIVVVIAAAIAAAAAGCGRSTPRPVKSSSSQAVAQMM